MTKEKLQQAYYLDCDIREYSRAIERIEAKEDYASLVIELKNLNLNEFIPEMEPLKKAILASLEQKKVELLTKFEEL